MIDIKEYHTVVKKLRNFFESRGFIEAPTQSRLSILAACEDPNTIATFKYDGKKWPLPQTGQMWLEYELLKQPSLPGCYCITTSYRQEPNPISGRHDTIFPLFEFETTGDMDHLIKLEEDLLIYLGFSAPFAGGDYEHIANSYGVREIGHAEEEKINRDFGPVFFLKSFPIHTSPFWNMKIGPENTAKKVDVILCGMETIGSAERSCDPIYMRQMFDTISGGKYRKTLYDQFGEDRVEEEIKKFLEHQFIPRCGGGIGITRLIRALTQISHISY